LSIANVRQDTFKFIGAPRASPLAFTHFWVALGMKEARRLRRLAHKVFKKPK
jgi:hypothetical protein